jgi:DNA-binding NtrC family response regulator
VAAGGIVILDITNSEGISVLRFWISYSENLIFLLHCSQLRCIQVTVLLVDDHDAVRRVIELLLAEAGYEVVSTGSSSEAIRFASILPELDVLVTDIVLDQGTGFDVQVFVHQHHPKAGTLFITGYAVPEMHPDDGRTAWLQKPFHHDELVSKLGDLLRSQQGRSSDARSAGLAPCPAA